MTDKATSGTYPYPTRFVGFVKKTTVKDGAVTFAKMQNIGSQKLIGRSLSGEGVPEQIGIGDSLDFDGNNLQVSFDFNQTLQTAGRQKAVASKTGNYTATANDEVIKFTSNATLTLPTATGSGQHYLVRAVGCTVIIDGAGSDTVNEEPTQTLNAGDSVQIVDDGVGTWGVY